MRKIYFQKFGGEFFGDFVFAAYEGFLHDRDADHYTLKFYEDINEVPVNIDTMVVGCVEDTKQYLEALGVQIPKAFNVPEWMQHMTSRNYRTMTVEEFFELPGDQPLFVKPVELKVFPGGVIKSHGMRRAALKDVPAGTMVSVSNVIDIVNEYRVFIRRGKIIGVKQYNQVYDQSEWFVFPDMNYVFACKAAMEQSGQAPAAYSIDAAVLRNGKTELIEVQDGWSIGSYGLDGTDYKQFLMDRWNEMILPVKRQRAYDAANKVVDNAQITEQSLKRKFDK